MTLILPIILRKKLTSKTKRISKAQISLFLIALWDFFFELCWTFHQTWVYTFVLRGDYYNPIFDVLFLAIPWLYDFVTLTRPYVILIFCKPVRTSLFKVLDTSRIIIFQSSAVQSATINPIKGIQVTKSGQVARNIPSIR